MKIAVIRNYSAGQSANSDKNTESLRNLFNDYKLKAEIHSVNSKTLVKKTQEIASSEVDALVVAGGDGTISTVAGILAGGKMPMGVLPFGTLNHFAKDCNIPLEIEKAVKVIATGKPVAIDVAEVNGHIFINNSSVGLYPKAVKLRDTYLRRLGGRKGMAMIMASMSAFSRFPLFRVKLQTESKTITRTTPFVFIGNNEYKFDLFNLGARTTFTGGKLSLYTAHCKRRLSVLWFVLLALFNRINQEKDFDVDFVREVKLETGKYRVKVALDGEVIYLKPPLHYRIRPKDLPVILPSKN